MRLQLFSIHADIFVFPELACLAELESPALDGARVHVDDPCDVAVVELWELEELHQKHPVGLGQLFPRHGAPLAMPLPSGTLNVRFVPSRNSKRGGRRQVRSGA